TAAPAASRRLRGTFSQWLPCPSGSNVAWKGWPLSVPSTLTSPRAGSRALASGGTSRNDQVARCGVAGRSRRAWNTVGLLAMSPLRAGGSRDKHNAECRPQRHSAYNWIRPPQRSTPMIPKNTICLWYDGTALEAATFYAETFPDSEVRAVHRAPADYPVGKKGDVLTVEFTVLGIPCLGLNGGPAFPQTEAFSFQVATDDQAETDRYWDAIVGNGGRESDCGWCKDKWGVSWQITPRVLTEAIADPDPRVARRAFEAMMTMSKIEAAAIEAARRG